MEQKIIASLTFSKVPSRNYRDGTFLLVQTLSTMFFYNQEINVFKVVLRF